MFLIKNFILFGILLPAFLNIFGNNGIKPVLCEDKVDDEIDEATIDTEGGENTVEETIQEEKDDEDESNSKGSPDADTVIYFVNPSGSGKELPAGKAAEFLVGFTNVGDQDFVLDSLEASLRYPMDFSYYIQNFSSISSQRLVKPKQEATVMYSFYPAEAFAGRPLGLTVNLAYHIPDGEEFLEAVFNQTIQITDVDEGFDGETFFLYIFLLAFAILLLLAGHHFLSSFGRKKGEVLAKKPVVETGTNIKDGIDYDWIPKELLNNLDKSPRTTSHTNSQSPRSRKKK